MQTSGSSSLPQTEPPTCREGACALEPKTFDHAWELNKHMKRHTLPYKCDVEGCSYSEGGDPGGFYQLRDLKRHETTHQPERSYHCYWPGCSSSATRAYNMVRHLREQHDIEEIKQGDVVSLCGQ